MVPRTALFARHLATLALAALSLAAAQADQGPEVGVADGPYVVTEDDETLRALSVEASTKKLVRTVKSGDDVDIPAVGNVPSFRVRLRPSAVDEPSAYTTSSGVPVFVVADTHGEYEILVGLLQKHRVIDASLRWSFRKGHLVFLGDVFDRGPNQTEILWLIYKLEAEAKKARGGVHLVLGNHEHMIMSGDVRYLNSKYVQTAQTLGVGSYSELFGTSTVLGQWLRAKPTVLKLNNLLCVHGGISREAIERGLSLQEISSIVRSSLGNSSAQVDEERSAFVMGKLGPLWFCGYFADQTDFPTASSADIDAIRKYYGVHHILVGHTIVPTITLLHDGKVIAVQVYPHRDEESGKAVMEALRIERGRFYRAKIDGSTELLQ